MKELITIAAEEYIDKWNAQHKCSIPYIEHKFNLRGKTAGQFCWRGSLCYFRWNMKIAEANSDDYLKQTVGHEVAHYIVRYTSPRAQSHGTAWQSTMSHMGLAPKRCHNYTVEPARIVPRPFIYHCPCGRTHKITAIKYRNFVMKGLSKGGRTNYSCNCGTYININDVKPVK